MVRRESETTRLLSVGEQAPDFSLEDQAGNLVTLREFRGGRNVVLIFYPGDDTPGCTKQLCAVRDQFGMFRDNDTAVFGVNPQDSKSHQRFIKAYDFPFPLLVDRGKKVASAYGCKGMLMTKRTVYGINKEGAIVFARRGKPSNEEIIAAFKE
ncbi:MAG: peroxiredoxin [Planctomycetota bacterium]